MNQNKAKAFFALVAFLLFSNSTLWAQCLSSNQDGVHVVQSKETLWGIAQQYNLNIFDICKWNNMEPNDPLYECRELVVSGSLLKAVPIEQGSGSSLSFSDSNNKKQSGKWHTVRRGETSSSLAELYGYTEKRFRQFNGLLEGRKIKPGSLVKSSDCICETIQVKDGSEKKSTASTQTNASSTDETEGELKTDSRGYMTIDESAMIDEINLMRSNPRGYVKHVKAYVKQYKEYWGADISPSAVKSLIKDLEKLSSLSTLRPHPCLYKVAKKHGEYLAKSGRFSHMDANNVGPWSRTKQACPQIKMSTSKGRSGMLIGSENLVAGHDNVRQSVIDLLIDAGISPPGHREALLAPEWRYVACYNFGTVNQMPNHWVQNFGR